MFTGKKTLCKRQSKFTILKLPLPRVRLVYMTASIKLTGLRSTWLECTPCRKPRKSHNNFAGTEVAQLSFIQNIQHPSECWAESVGNWMELQVAREGVADSHSCFTTVEKLEWFCFTMTAPLVSLPAVLCVYETVQWSAPFCTLTWSDHPIVENTTRLGKALYVVIQWIHCGQLVWWAWEDS